MFSRFCLGALFALGAFSSFYATANEGHFAGQQLRHIATYFPGRMVGSPAEMLNADYLQQQFRQWGYESNKRNFTARYQYKSQDGRLNDRSVTATSVIAARAGEVPQQIVILAQADTYLPQSDADRQKNRGGLTLQGVDDNASGLAVMLELAQRLQSTQLHYSLRFVALSGSSLHGEEDYLARMKPEEKKNTLLVVKLSDLITGSKLWFNSGANTPEPVARQTRDRALAIARSLHIPAATLGKAVKSEPATEAFDKAGIPLLSVRAANWDKKGRLLRTTNSHFPQGSCQQQASCDNLAWIDRWLPGRIERRTHDSVAILLPLIRELANPQPNA
ncbi:aminopeptidase [Kalamiella sp. sgz302252]|uniref:aminopeptidase n=1 Tax=Pantoea sp. sgz302252 TaxID=3341827 RepID=UPI0036D2153D